MNCPIAPSLAFVLAVCAGCNASQKSLAEVAKDWSRVIRASQVIPVYPLTEDLQPGDVFLVQLPIDRQQELWEQDEYLPLDNHLARLDPDYDEFYDRSFFDDVPGPVLPRAWMRRSAGPPPVDAWSLAPSAGFPTYSFSVDQRGGLDLALPLGSVPIGLGLLGAQSAECTVELSDARTLGVDTSALREQVETWAIEDRELLGHYAPGAGEEVRNYVRVVGRIYLVGAIDLSIRTKESRSGGVSAGKGEWDSPAAMIATEPSSGTLYQESLRGLSELLNEVAGLAPGGKLLLTSISSRSVSMRETFARPLVVGYLGFDFPILAGGRLGRPIPTHAALTGQAPTDTVVLETRQRFHNAVALDVYHALDALSQESAQRVVQAFDGLAALVDEDRTLYSSARSGVRASTFQSEAGMSGYLNFRAYQGSVQGSQRILESIVAGETAAPDGLSPSRAAELVDEQREEAQRLAEAEQPLLAEGLHVVRELLLKQD